MGSDTSGTENRSDGSESYINKDSIKIKNQTHKSKEDDPQNFNKNKNKNFKNWGPVNPELFKGGKNKEKLIIEFKNINKGNPNKKKNQRGKILRGTNSGEVEDQPFTDSQSRLSLESEELPEEAELSDIRKLIHMYLQKKGRRDKKTDISFDDDSSILLKKRKIDESYVSERREISGREREPKPKPKAGEKEMRKKLTTTLAKLEERINAIQGEMTELNAKHEINTQAEETREKNMEIMKSFQKLVTIKQVPISEMLIEERKQIIMDGIQIEGVIKEMGSAMIKAVETLSTSIERAMEKTANTSHTELSNSVDRIRKDLSDSRETQLLRNVEAKFGKLELEILTEHKNLVDSMETKEKAVADVVQNLKKNHEESWAFLNNNTQNLQGMLQNMDAKGKLLEEKIILLERTKNEEWGFMKYELETQQAISQLIKGELLEVQSQMVQIRNEASRRQFNGERELHTLTNPPPENPFSEKQIKEIALENLKDELPKAIEKEFKTREQTLENLKEGLPKAIEKELKTREKALGEELSDKIATINQKIEEQTIQTEKEKSEKEEYRKRINEKLSSIKEKVKSEMDQEINKMEARWRNAEEIKDRQEAGQRKSTEEALIRYTTTTAEKAGIAQAYVEKIIPQLGNFLELKGTIDHRFKVIEQWAADAAVIKQEQSVIKARMQGMIPEMVDIIQKDFTTKMEAIIKGEGQGRLAPTNSNLIKVVSNVITQSDVIQVQLEKILGKERNKILTERVDALEKKDSNVYLDMRLKLEELEAKIRKETTTLVEQARGKINLLEKDVSNILGEGWKKGNLSLTSRSKNYFKKLVSGEGSIKYSSTEETEETERSFLTDRSKKGLKPSRNKMEKPKRVSFEDDEDDIIDRIRNAEFEV